MNDLSIAELGKRLRDGTLSAMTLTEQTLGRISAEQRLSAFVAVTAKRAHAAAERADRELARGIDRGPMHGIPYAAKELFDVQGIATTGQSRLSAVAAAKDAHVVTLLEQAGAVLVGKTATYELAIAPGPSLDGPFPPARNPHNPEHATGGSSSGSAAAVAGGLVRFALGTDTGGSIRAPAAYCNAVGLKPTCGRVSRTGVMPLSSSLDHVGPIASTVVDAAIAMDAMADFDPHDSASVDAASPGCVAQLDRGVTGLRIAYARSFHGQDGDASIRDALDKSAEIFARLGAIVEEVELPSPALFDAAAVVIIQADAFALHREALRRQPHAFGRVTFQHLAAGAVLSDDDLARAQRLRRELTQVLQTGVFARFDAMITANVLGTAPRFDGTSPPNPMRVFPFNVTGHPALALPMGKAANGLPIGLQLVGRYFDEATLCRLGAAFEQHLTVAELPPAQGHAA